jgi:hypothetical protein
MIQTGNLVFPDPKVFGKIPIYIKELSFLVGDDNRIQGLIEEFKRIQKDIILEE